MLRSKLPRKGGDECQWALTRKQTLWGGGPEVGDLRLLEDGGECGGALGSDAVAGETAGKGQYGKRGERVGVSTGADTKGVQWRT